MNTNWQTMWAPAGLIMVAIAVLAFVRAPAMELRAAPETVERYRTETIRLTAGEAPLGEVIGLAMDAAGMDGQLARQTLHGGLNVNSPGAKVWLASVHRLSRGVVSFDVTSQLLVVKVDRLAQRRELQRLADRMGGLLSQWAPDGEPIVRRHALLEWREGGVGALGEGRVDQHVVLLTPGYEEHTRIWRDLGPRLIDAGFQTLEMRYPPMIDLDAAADALRQHLMLLRSRGAMEVTLMGHGSGGLVCRAVVQSLAVEDDAAVSARYPKFRRVVLVATPNSGMELAAVDLPIDIVNDLVRRFSGDGLLFGSAFDLEGALREDLTPGSEFLRRINALPPPVGVPVSVVSGSVSPIDKAEFDRLKESGMLERAGVDSSVLDVLWSQMYLLHVGDGVVSHESAQLSWAEPMRQVRANHVAMIADLSLAGRRTPPALSPIVQLLRGDRGDYPSPGQLRPPMRGMRRPADGVSPRRAQPYEIVEPNAAAGGAE